MLLENEVQSAPLVCLLNPVRAATLRARPCHHSWRRATRMPHQSCPASVERSGYHSVVMGEGVVDFGCCGEEACGRQAHCSRHGGYATAAWRRVDRNRKVHSEESLWQQWCLGPLLVPRPSKQAAMNKLPPSPVENIQCKAPNHGAWIMVEGGRYSQYGIFTTNPLLSNMDKTWGSGICVFFWAILWISMWKKVRAGFLNEWW